MNNPVARFAEWLYRRTHGVDPMPRDRREQEIVDLRRQQLDIQRRVASVETRVRVMQRSSNGEGAS